MKPTPFKRQLAPGVIWGEAIVVAASARPTRRGPSWTLLLLASEAPHYKVEVIEPIIPDAGVQPDHYLARYTFRTGDLAAAVDQFAWQAA